MDGVMGREALSSVKDNVNCNDDGGSCGGISRDCKCRGKPGV